MSKDRRTEEKERLWNEVLGKSVLMNPQMRLNKLH